MALKLVPGGHPYHASEAAANAARDGNVEAMTLDNVLAAHDAIAGRCIPSLIDMAHSPPTSRRRCS